MKIVALAVILAAMLHAQADKVVSPEVHPDRRVTFRLYAPKAQEVTINGDWMKLGTKEKMERDSSGVWTWTGGPFVPQWHLYSFTVDGMTIADPVNPRMKLRARTSASLVEVPGDALWNTRDVPHGMVTMVTHHSKALRDVRELYVYTPPGYSANGRVRYPVLYLMHGNNDVAAGWTWTGRAHTILDNLLAEKKITPMIVVMPWAHAAPFGTPGTKNTDLFEQYLLSDVLPTVEAQLRINPEERAIAGLSMGAGQALHIALRHPDKFDHAGIFSMGGAPSSFSEVHKAALDNPDTVNKRVQTLWISIGREDEGFERNRQLRALLKKHGIRFTEAEGEGGHFYPVFRRELAEFLPMIFRR